MLAFLSIYSLRYVQNHYIWLPLLLYLAALGLTIYLECSRYGDGSLVGEVIGPKGQGLNSVAARFPHVLLEFLYTMQRHLHLRTQFPSFSGRHEISIAPAFPIMPCAFTHAVKRVVFCKTICELQPFVIPPTDRAV